MPGDVVTTEEGIIQPFLAPLAAGYPGAFGLEDDCAVAQPSPGHEFVLKTDAIAEGVHFLATDAPSDIGWKALAVNVSDLAAKAARPVGYLMSLAFPTAPERAWLEGFASGLGEAQTAFGMHLMGGDTDRRPGPISITPMVIGEAPVGRMVRRATAADGDILYVSGTLGDAALGLRLRRQPALAAAWRLTAAEAASLEQRYLRPSPRLGLSRALRSAAHAAMDLSDGLAKDLGRMAKASGVGARIEHAKLPVSHAFAAVRAADPAAAAVALFAGDDYEVLAAVPDAAAARFERLSRDEGCQVTAIGEVRRGPGVEWLDDEGRPTVMDQTGWDHF